jgi:hypothetical protein
VRAGRQRREEHEPLDARALGGLDHPPRRDRVEFLDRAVRLVADRRGEVDDGPDAAQGVAERRRIGQVAQRDLHADALGPQPARVAHEAAHGLPRGGQTAQEGGPDEPGGAGEQQHVWQVSIESRAPAP